MLTVNKDTKRVKMRKEELEFFEVCQKIEANPSQPKYIESVSGVGYRFRLE